jgi:hypothetical protein
MKIHPTDGSIEFARGSVTRTTDKASFLASPLAGDAEVVVDNPPYVTYRISPESGIGATLCFKDQRLEYLAWGLSMPTEAEQDWSEESELKRMKIHDEWLRSELGQPPYRFSWGRVVSEYDAKSVSSAIIVVYDR